MSDKDPKQDQNITPAGQVELDEAELDQVTGGGDGTGKYPDLARTDSNLKLGDIKGENINKKGVSKG